MSRDLDELPDGDQQLVQAPPQGGMTGGTVADPVLADLRVRNIAEAVVQGRPGARRELGVLVYGLLVCGGKQR